MKAHAIIRFSILVILLILKSRFSFCITPAKCVYELVKGKWTFYIGKGGHNNTLNCTGFTTDDAIESYDVTLHFPDVVVDQYGEKGFWTQVLVQGFEVVIGDTKYFAYSKYKDNPESFLSICGETFPGWRHRKDGTDWACYIGIKDVPVPPISTPKIIHRQQKTVEDTAQNIVSAVNFAQTLWKASEYADIDYEQLKMSTMAGYSSLEMFPQSAPVSPDVAKLAASLPENFDWRSVNGVSYVSPVRKQGRCGCCYAFASLGMNEARIRIMTNNTQKPIFSPQDVVDCTEYSQGCKGGFEYLIGGKYAEDFGLVEEKCNPYTGTNSSTCTTDVTCPRTFSTKYEYIGGFYGACNEPLMRINLVKNGPLTVAFMMYDDFYRYKTGIYYHTGLDVGFNPHEEISHVSLLVGYGTDKTDPDNPIDYWIVKNSWGSEWGEDGYFRIRRGVDECAIEGSATQSFPIL